MVDLKCLKPISTKDKDRLLYACSSHALSKSLMQLIDLRLVLWAH